MPACPPDDVLSGYLDDTLPPAEAARLSLHVDTCESCQLRLDQLTAGSTVVERYRRVESAILAPTPPPARGSDGAYQTQMLGSEGIPLVPRIEPVRPQLPGYVVTDEIGRGGMGVVYRAEQKRLNRPVALKLILAGGLADPRVTQRFLFEGEVLARVRHPQVVEVYEVGMHTGPTGVTFPFLAMELLDRGTLLGWAADGPRSPKEAVELMEGLARAVHAAHLQGVIHRDLKPANILRGADGRFKVSDFGLAKLVQETSLQLTGTGTVVGTPAYMAPEQAAGAKTVGPAADVYSLGAILFELLTGRPPFPGQEAMGVMLRVLNEPAPSVRSVRPDVPRDLSAVVMKCLTKEPHRRYQSAEQLADDLKRFREDRPTRARPHTATELAWYWGRRNPAVASLLLCLAGVMATAFISAVVLWQKAENTAEQTRQEKLKADLLAKVASDERDEAARLRREADRNAAYLAFDQAVRQCEDGQIGDGLRAFVRALELAEATDDSELARVIRVNVAAWQTELLPPGRRFRHAADAVVRSAAFSPDGKWVLTGGSDGRVNVWDADTGKRAATLTIDGGPKDPLERAVEAVESAGLATAVTIRAVAANHDRTRLAAGLSNGVVVVWEVDGEAGSETAPLPPKLRVRPRTEWARLPDLWSVQYAPDGSLWVCGDHGVLEHLDAGGKTIDALPVSDDGSKETKNRSVMAMRVSSDGARVLSGDRLGRVIEWDVGGRVATATWRPSGWVTAVGYSADDRIVAFTGTTGRVQAWERPADETQGWRMLLDAGLGGSYGHGVAVSADGRRVAAADEDGKVRVWDVRTGTAASGVIRAGAEMRKLSFRPGTDDLLLPQDDSVRVQPLPPPSATPMAVPTLKYRVRALDFRPTDGGELLVGSNSLLRFDPATGTALAAPDLKGEPLAAVYAEGGDAIQYGMRGAWGVVPADGAAPARPFATGTGYVGNLVGRPTADRLEVFSGRDFQRWSTDRRLELQFTPQCLKKRDVGPAAAVFAPDRSELRLAVADGIEFAHPVTGKPTRPSLPATDAINDLAQTADGKRVFAGLRDATVQGWEVGTAKPLYPTPPRHTLAVTSLDVRGDGAMLLSGSRDHTARFWDGPTGLPLGPALQHPDPVTKVALSPDGIRAATGTSAGRAAVWPTPPPPDQTPVDQLKKRFAPVVGAAYPVSREHE